MSTCGYCRAGIPEAEMTRHDIQAHNGLERTRDGHRQLCVAFGGGNCICRIEEYERVAKEGEQGR